MKNSIWFCPKSKAIYENVCAWGLWWPLTILLLISIIEEQFWSSSKCLNNIWRWHWKHQLSCTILNFLIAWIWRIVIAHCATFNNICQLELQRWNFVTVDIRQWTIEMCDRLNAFDRLRIQFRQELFGSITEVLLAEFILISWRKGWLWLFIYKP